MTTTTITKIKDSSCKALQPEGCLMLRQSFWNLDYNAPIYSSTISQGMFRQSMSISQCLVKLILHLSRNCHFRASIPDKMLVGIFWLSVCIYHVTLIFDPWQTSR